MSNKGFSIWQVQGLPSPNKSDKKVEKYDDGSLNNMIKLQQQSKASFLSEESIS